VTVGAAPLEHDPEKWVPVSRLREAVALFVILAMLRRAKAGPKRSCSNNKLERDDDSKKSHLALSGRG
jgi:hypothetical protein